MLRKTFLKFDYRLAIFGLVVIIGGTILAGVFGGLSLAGVIGIILFIIFDGLGCIWTVLTYSTAKKICDEHEVRERDRFVEKTKDNPTLR
jgi:hypothetical protein